MKKNSHETALLFLRKIGLRTSAITHTRMPKAILRRIFRHAKGIVQVSDFDGDLSIQLELSEHMQRRIFWMGYYSEGIAKQLIQILKPGMTVLDIGANIGEITLLAAKHVGQQGQVFSFEPIDAIASQLATHVQMNFLHQVSIESYALSDSNVGGTPIYASCGQESTDPNVGLGSLYGGESGETPLQYIQTLTLDSWLKEHPNIQNIDLIKIDIEGAELACLHGARECLKKYRPRIIIEIQDFSASKAGYKSQDILDFLSSYGYMFQTITANGSLTPLTPSNLVDYQNVLCTPHTM